MDSIQERHERAVGDALIAWLNRRDGRSLSFLRRGDDAPDLIYREGFDDLGLEIVGAYYDQDDAALLWQNARNVPNGPIEWLGVNFDSALLRNIELRVREKCRKAYGPSCALLVAVRPALTTAPEMHDLLGQLSLPDDVPFVAIYVAGDFPVSPTASGGYSAWQVWPR